MIYIFINRRWILGFLLFSFTARSDISERMKKDREKAIENCEIKYELAKNNYDDFAKFIISIKKPGIFSSDEAAKYKYENKLHALSNTKSLLEQLHIFTNEKINLRLQIDSKKLQDSVVAYASNCGRFTSGLIDFILWFSDPAKFKQKIKDDKKITDDKTLEQAVKALDSFYKIQIADEKKRAKK